MQANQTSERPFYLKMSRRTFLRNVAAALSGGVLVACTAQRSNDPPFTLLGPAATPRQLLPSPQPAEADQTVTLPPDPAALEDFLALSAVLAGVPTLSPVLGQIYLQSLQTNGQFAQGLVALYEQAGLRSTPAPTLEELEGRGLFAQESTQMLVDAILEHWYTGVYATTEGEEQVATFVDALAWKTLTFTKPMTLCGSPGFWSEVPERIVD